MRERRRTTVLSDHRYEERPYNDDLVEDDGTVMGDIYDLYSEAIKNHGPITLMSEDMYLSDLHGSGHEGDEERFVREQMKLAIIVKRYIRDKNEAIIAAHAIMIDPNTIGGFSRTRNGKVIKAILTYGRDTTPSELQEKRSLKDRIFGKKREDDDE